MPTEVQIYKDGTVVAADIAADAVGTLNIKDGNVTSAKLEANSNGKGKRTVSTLQPSSASGINGDIWYVVEAASSSSSIVSNATQVTGPDNVDTADLVSGTMAQNDKFRIRISANPDPITGATADNGFAEIATANEGNEPIYVRQYTSTGSGSGINYFANITRTATLLDRNGNTTFPGIVTATSVSGNGTIPVGGIIMWSGTIEAAQALTGWELCDGENGTPDLRERFVVGAGGNNPTVAGTTGYNVNDKAGSNDATLVSHGHTGISTVTDPGHIHTSTLFNGLGSGFAGGGGQGQRGSISVGINTTGITVATTISTVGVSSINANLPPYYALAFIMRTV